MCGKTDNSCFLNVNIIKLKAIIFFIIIIINNFKSHFLNSYKILYLIDTRNVT